MTQDDVLFGYRLQLFALAASAAVSQACRLMGVHRSTYYRWKGMVERSGLEMLRPAGAAAAADAQPALGDGRAADRRVLRSAIPGSGRGGSRRGWRGREWGGLVVSAQRRLQDAVAGTG